MSCLIAHPDKEIGAKKLSHQKATKKSDIGAKDGMLTFGLLPFWQVKCPKEKR